MFHIRTLDNTSDPIWKQKQKFYWQDKAGGYGIQDPFGMKYVKRIEGDYWNVVGLPVSMLCQMLEELGVDI